MLALDCSHFWDCVSIEKFERIESFNVYPFFHYFLFKYHLTCRGQMALQHLQILNMNPSHHPQCPSLEWALCHMSLQSWSSQIK